MKTLMLFLLLGLSGCATVDRLGTPQNFAKCATFDVATTTIGLATNRMHEIDPLAKALTIHGHRARGRLGRPGDRPEHRRLLRAQVARQTGSHRDGGGIDLRERSA